MQSKLIEHKQHIALRRRHARGETMALARGDRCL